MIAFSLLTALPGLPWSPRSPDIPGAPLIKTTARNKQTKESKMLNLKKKTVQRNLVKEMSKKNTGFVQLTTVPPTPLSPNFPTKP